MPYRIGQQLGNYRLMRLLGVGGFAEVYLGQHVHLETPAAIKVLHTSLDSGDVKRFYTEARTIAGLVHPHILRILDLGVQDGLPYLVMDYAPKGTARHLHPPGTQLPLVTVVSYIRQVAEALQFAHDVQIIHRDVKPDNLLVGNRRALLLSDFGLAVFAGLPPLEQAGGGPAVVGSVGYLAPEQFLGQPSAASDQYALGIVAYEWIAGDLPFVGTPDEIVDQHLSVLPPSLRERAPDLPPAVEQVILTALAKDPASRYPSVWDFAIALEQAASSREATALPHSLAPRVGRRNALSPVSGQSHHSLPETIAAVLDLRLEALSPACQRLLGKASVVGGSFELSLIHLMEHDASPEEGEDALLDVLDEALSARVLSEESVEGRVTYHFWHPLLVSHLYNTLSAGRRAFLHRRAAEALQEVYAGREAEGAATITYHLVRGRAGRQRIASFAELAGDAAYVLSAYPEAERYYRLALDQCDEAADPSPSVSVTERLHLASLVERLGECMRFQGNEEEARRLYQRVLEVRPPLDETASPMERQRESELRALLWCAIGQTWYNAGNDLQAEQCFERGELALRQAGVVAGPAWAGLRFEQGYLYWREGKYEDAHRAAQEALALFEEVLAGKPSGASQSSPSTRIRHTLAGDPVDLGRTHVLLGNIVHTVGRPADALVHWNTALAIFEQHHCLREIAIVCCNLSDIYLRKAEHTLARASLRRSLALVERVGDIPLQSVVFCNLGILAAREGELAEAESAYKQSLELAERSNALAYVSAWLVYLATALLDQGKRAEAEATLHRALSLSRSLNHAPSTGLALIVLGQMRMWQAKQMFSEGTPTRLRLLRRARGSLQRAFSCQGLEAEVSTEGKIILAEVALLLGALDEAYQMTLDTLEVACMAELTALIARSERLLGCILAVRGEYEQGDQHFEQALRIFNTSAMRLEYARTLQHYGVALMRRGKKGREVYQTGVRYLHEARQVFSACRAMPDVQIVERILADIPDDAAPHLIS